MNDPHRAAKFHGLQNRFGLTDQILQGGGAAGSGGWDRLIDAGRKGKGQQQGKAAHQ
jgi:hypothetical protein